MTHIYRLVPTRLNSWVELADVAWPLGNTDYLKLCAYLKILFSI